MQYGEISYSYVLTNILPTLWRRRWLICAAVLLTTGAAVLFHSVVGDRYESYTLLRVGQGIKDRSAGSVGGPFGEGLDLVSRIDSLARIATTDHVIRQAALQVGFARLLKSGQPGMLSKLSQWVTQFDFVQELSKQLDSLKASSDSDGDSNDNLRAIATLRDLISTKAEGRSDLLRISFRHRDPAIGAEFLNHLANSLVATQADLVQVPGADIFFQQQTKRLEEAAEKAGSDLRNFSVAASIYSVADQRSLLLKRADELGSLISGTRSSIEDRKGQKQAILDQLMLLRPVYQSKTVTSIVNNLRGRDQKEGPNTVAVPNFEEAPPLLLVKVYQDAMASLLKVNTDLNGSIRLEKSLVAELEKINAELASLSSKEAEYDRLKRVLVRASGAADHYGSRALEEQINLDIAKKAQLSSVRVVQTADKPATPMFPRMIHLIMLGLAGGMALGSGIALMLEFGRARAQDYGPERSDDAAGEPDMRPRSAFSRDIQAAE